MSEPKTEPRGFAVRRTIDWRYTTLEHTGRCRLDGKELTVRLTLEAEELLAVPDVLSVEAWLGALVKGEPTTVEELAVAAAEQWFMRVTAKGESRTHGVIEATCEV